LQGELHDGDHRDDDQQRLDHHLKQVATFSFRADKKRVGALTMEFVAYRDSRNLNSTTPGREYRRFDMITGVGVSGLRKVMLIDLPMWGTVDNYIMVEEPVLASAAV
jgi:hypothetical protein